MHAHSCRRRFPRAAWTAGVLFSAHALAAGAAVQFDVPLAQLRLNLIPGAMAVADLNGDGWQDWILCSASFRFLDIFAGIPGGGFDPTPVRVTWTSEELWGSTNLEVADTDGDGILDLIIAGSGVGRLRGRGGFRFEFESIVPELRGVYVPGSVLGDVDGDGDLDLVVSTYAGGAKVETLRGDGTGAFQHGPTTALRQLNPTTRSGHFDPGPTLDVIVGGENGSFVLLGQTDGVLLPAARAGGSAYTRTLGVGDVDGDGLDDVAVADQSGLLVIWTGAGFPRGAVLSTEALLTDALVVADLNRDGFADVGAVRHRASRIDVYNGHGDGTFDPAWSIPVATAPVLVRAVDLDGDQAPEVLVATSLDWAGVHGSRDEFLAPGRVLRMGTRAAGLAVADWNNDGHVDVTVSDPARGEIVLRAGTAGGYSAPVRTGVGGAPSTLCSADWNRDGIPDLFLLDAADASVNVLLASGGQGLGARMRLPVPAADAVDVLDVDGDGALDVAGVSTAPNPLQLVWVALGTGTGGIRSQSAYELPGRPSNVTLADWDGDGHADLLVPCRESGQVVWLPANGDGTFQPARVLASRLEPTAVTVGDFDADGSRDLVVEHAGVRGMTLFRRAASGALIPAVPFDTNGTTGNLRTADLDADGIRDLVLTGSDFQNVQIVAGQPSLTHASLQNVATGRGTALAVADAQGDGLPELWVADDAAGTVTILANQSTRTPVFAADVRIRNQDGRVQLAWQIRGSPAGELPCRVERAPLEAGPWDPRGPAVTDGTWLRFEEPSPREDAWYRLRLTRSGGDLWTAPALVTAAAAASRLDVPREIAGMLAIRFELATASRARLDVFDVRGRRLRSWNLAGSAPSAGQVVWDRRDAAGSHVGRGMVFVQLDAAGTRRTRKAVLWQP